MFYLPEKKTLTNLSVYIIHFYHQLLFCAAEDGRSNNLYFDNFC